MSLLRKLLGFTQQSSTEKVALTPHPSIEEVVSELSRIGVGVMEKDFDPQFLLKTLSLKVVPLRDKPPLFLQLDTACVRRRVKILRRKGSEEIVQSAPIVGPPPTQEQLLPYIQEVLELLRTGPWPLKQPEEASESVCEAGCYGTG